MYKWRRRTPATGQQTKDLVPAREFVPLPIAPTAAAVAVGDIRIFIRRGSTTVDIEWPVSGAESCAQWLRELMLERRLLHSDEMPVSMLVPGKGNTHRAYIYSYGTTTYGPLHAVIYDFAEGRGGQHAQRFLMGWRGKLVCDDF